MEHTRIDEGVKRGPRKIPQRMGIKKRDPVNGQALRVMPADLQPEQVIDRYLQDERTQDIARSYGVERSRLNQWLLKNASEQWRDAQIARAVTAHEQAKDELAAASDPLSLGRAREQLRAAQWELERLYARMFGQQTHVTMEITGDLGDRLRRSKERVIEHEPANAVQQLPEKIIGSQTGNE